MCWCHTVMAIFGLFLVSLLAVFGNARITDPLVVSHKCEGQTLCDIKPADYPQEQIDRLVVENLHRLHRMRRSASEVDNTSSESDACPFTKKMITPYTVKRKDVLYVVQNQFLSQPIQETSCTDEGSSCFESLLRASKSTCSNKITQMTLIVMTKTNELVNIPVDVKTDCYCSIGAD